MDDPHPKKRKARESLPQTDEKLNLQNLQHIYTLLSIYLFSGNPQNRFILVVN